VAEAREQEDFNNNFAALLPIFDVMSGFCRRRRHDEFPANGLDEARRPPPTL